jgi:hypothetical protein
MTEIDLANNILYTDDISNRDNGTSLTDRVLRKKTDIQQYNIYINTIFDTPESPKTQALLKLKIGEILNLTGYKLFAKQNASSIF